MNKIITSIFFLLGFFAFANYATAQKENKNCFEVKYLDFFGLDKIDKLNWSDQEIDKLLKMDYEKDFSGTRFFIPPLVFQFKDFHPNCNKSIDTKRFDRLIALYLKINLDDNLLLENKSVEEKLNFIRDDFYRLVQIEELLTSMKFTFDDGPLHGEITKNVPKTKPLETSVTNFGKLLIIESNKQIFLVATDKENKPIWSRIRKGTNPDRYLGNLRFDKNPIEKTSLAMIIHFYSEGERLNLYLKEDGKFMYYYHSW